MDCPSYGVNGLVFNLHQTSNYSFRIGPAALWKSLSFYFSKLFRIPYAGLLLLVAPLAVRDRRLSTRSRGNLTLPLSEVAALTRGFRASSRFVDSRLLDSLVHELASAGLFNRRGQIGPRRFEACAISEHAATASPFDP